MKGEFGKLAVVALVAGLIVPVSAAPTQRHAQPTIKDTDPVKSGVDAWQSGNYARALNLWRPLAAAGNPDAQYNLAQAYRLGRGVAVDEKVAQDWYYKAAVQNHPQAQANYGLLLFQSGDRKGALPWLQKAADRGDPRAQYVVGTALFNGDIVPKDWVRGYALMTRAAAAGLPAAATSLAEMDRYVPLQQRQQGTALARDLERSAALAMADDAAGQLVRTSPMPPKASPDPVVAWVAAPPAVAAQRPTTKPTPSETPVNAAPATKTPPPPKPPAKPMPLPAAAGIGGWRIQVGAFADPAAAGQVWDAIARKTPGLGLRSYLVKAGPVTRLQAGPLGSRADASRACARVKAASGSACFPVTAP